MKYHKIKTVFDRDPDNNYRTLIDGQFAKPEFEYLQDNKWVFTEKVDGTNIRVIWDGSSVEFRGRTDKAQIPPFLLRNLEGMFKRAFLSDVFDGTDGEVVLYGEGYGNKIQKVGSSYIANDTSFVLFDVYIGMWLKREDVHDIADSLGIRHVPVVGEGPLLDAVEMAQDGFTSTWGDFPAEGLVMRPATELLNRRGERVITKIKCKDFPGA